MNSIPQALRITPPEWSKTVLAESVLVLLPDKDDERPVGVLGPRVSLLVPNSGSDGSFKSQPKDQFQSNMQLQQLNDIDSECSSDRDADIDTVHAPDMFKGLWEDIFPNSAYDTSNFNNDNESICSDEVNNILEVDYEKPLVGVAPQAKEIKQVQNHDYNKSSLSLSLLDENGKEVKISVNSLLSDKGSTGRIYKCKLQGDAREYILKVGRKQFSDVKSDVNDQQRIKDLTGQDLKSKALVNQSGLGVGVIKLFVDGADPNIGSEEYTAFKKEALSKYRINDLNVGNVFIPKEPKDFGSELKKFGSNYYVVVDALIYPLGDCS